MAFSIHLNRLTQNDKYALYEYGSTGKNFGKIRIDKANGDIYLLKLAEDDDSEAQAKRAGFALIKHWKKNEFPESAYWAS